MPRQAKEATAMSAAFPNPHRRRRAARASVVAARVAVLGLAVGLVLGLVATTGGMGGLGGGVAGAQTSSTSESTTTTTSASTTTEAPTTTERRTTTTEERTTTSASTTSTSASTTTTAPSTTVATSEKKMPWLAIGLVAAVLVLLGLVALRSRTANRRHWRQVDALLADGGALVDLGRAGPAAGAPDQQVAHWSALEQRAQALGTAAAAVRAGSHDSQARGVLDQVGQASDQYLDAIGRARALRLGPPAPTAEQLSYADAEARQRLESLAATLTRLDGLAAPHR